MYKEKGEESIKDTCSREAYKHHDDKVLEKEYKKLLEDLEQTKAENEYLKKSFPLVLERSKQSRKKYSSVVTGIAILEDVIMPNNLEECLKICKNRSIFSEQEIKNLFSKYKTIIKLLYYAPLKNKVILNDLYEDGIIEVNSGPRPFQQISKEQYEIIVKTKSGGIKNE